MPGRTRAGRLAFACRSASSGFIQVSGSGELLPDVGRLHEVGAALPAVTSDGAVASDPAARPTVRAHCSLINGLWNALSSGVVALVGLLSSVIVVRTLSPHDYGVMSYYLWLAGLCATLGMLAFAPSLTKVGAELMGAGHSQTADALAAWVGRTLGWINLGIAVALLLVALLSPGNRVYLYLIAGLQLPTALASVLSSRFWSHQNFRVVSLWNLLGSVVQLLLIVAVLRLSHNDPALAIPGLTFAVLSAGLTNWLGLSWQSRVFGRAPRVAPPADVLRHYLAFLLPASLAMIFETVVWQRSELFFINRLGDAVQLGHYSLAYTIFAIFLSVGWALVTSYFPSIASDHGGGQHHLVAQKLQQGATLAVLYAAPISCGAVVTLPVLVELLYGAKMLPAVPIGQMLLVSLVPSVLAGMYSLTVNAIGGIWRNVWLGLAIAAVNVILDLTLIPRLGAFGGAVATVCAQCLYLVGLLLLAGRRFDLNVSWRRPAQILAAALLTTFFVPALIARLLGGLPGLALSVAVGGGLYGLYVWKAGLLRPAKLEDPR